MTLPFAILDLSPIVAGATAADALANSRDLAQHAERWGYTRYWLAEHHNMRGIASAATAVVIGHVAAGTSTLRVGAGGVMLPNHAPLVIAEQFGTLASLFPGRIDLGLGRAPGTDPATTRALRRGLASNPVTSADDFPQDVLELQAYFREPEPGQTVQAVPGAGLDVPLWILGSSLYGAQLAAHLGLPYAFASHFAPDYLHAALRVYRETFRPSAQLQAPYAMVGVNVIAADTDMEAARLFTSLQQHFVSIRRNQRGQLPPPVASMAGRWTPQEEAATAQTLACSVVGSLDTVTQGLADLIARTGADELMLTAHIYDHAARLRSFELAAQARERLAEKKGSA